MEVPGKKRDPNLEKVSANATIYCQTCGEGGKRDVAEGFCHTCEEYMCAPCIEYHKRLKISRNHIMLSKDKMPSFYPSIKKSAIADTEYCKDHPKEMIKFYCPTHGDLGCGYCVVLDHRSCKIDYIADVAKEFVIGNEFKELEPSIKRAEKLLSGYIINVNELSCEVENQAMYEIDRLKRFRAEINTYLERREKDLLENLQKMKNEDENVLHTLKTDCEFTKTGLESMRTKLTSANISVNQRYMTARRARKELRGINDKLETMADRMKARKYRFTKDADTERLMGSKMGIGTLKEVGEFRREIPVPDLSTVRWKNEADIHVRTLLDMDACCITSLALFSPGLLLVADWNSLKLVNITARTVTTRLRLPAYPFDVCVLPDDRAAVTLPNKSIIQLVSTKGGQLSRGKEIKVSSECCGIASYNNRLYVSYLSNPCIEVISLDGHILSTFRINDGNYLFQTPNFLTVSASTTPTLYVSDNATNTVLQLSMNGRVLQKYRDKQLLSPQSVVAVCPGQLLVCGQSSNNVMLLTERDGKLTEILGQKDGLINPYSVAFCPRTRAIVVCVFMNDSLKVLKEK
ncbi:uncharacterized protein LOC128242281 [Mya arenaria]|uniref:uncharacterized protein LOC128242281 n=1 Tax=Mya arenaria TaxID=6604 RepID=UPI0022E1CFA2|nr:uncharacterized protein LOC128242281 [Mya arenaria]